MLTVFYRRLYIIIMDEKDLKELVDVHNGEHIHGFILGQLKGLVKLQRDDELMEVKCLRLNFDATSDMFGLYLAKDKDAKRGYYVRIYKNKSREFKSPGCFEIVSPLGNIPITRDVSYMVFTF